MGAGFGGFRWEIGEWKSKEIEVGPNLGLVIMSVCWNLCKDPMRARVVRCGRIYSGSVSMT